MTEVVEVSPRLLLANRLAEFCADSRLMAFNKTVHTNFDGKDRKHYRINLLPSIDVSIKVYGEKSMILVSRNTPFMNGQHSMIFKREDHLLEFLKAAYILKDDQLVIKSLMNAH